MAASKLLSCEVAGRVISLGNMLGRLMGGLIHSTTNKEARFGADGLDLMMKTVSLIGECHFQHLRELITIFSTGNANPSL
jgi:hypothetical protein